MPREIFCLRETIIPQQEKPGDIGKPGEENVP
jgi:hypothetical protein